MRRGRTELLHITVCSFFEMGCISKYCFPPRVTGNLKPCSHSEWFHTGRIGCKILSEELEPEDMNSDSSTYISKDWLQLLPVTPALVGGRLRRISEVHWPPQMLDICSSKGLCLKKYDKSHQCERKWWRTWERLGDGSGWRKEKEVKNCPNYVSI